MTRSRTIISAIATLSLGSLMAAPALGALSASPNPSTTGSYTVSDASPPTLPADVSNANYERYYYYNLVETPPSGSATSYDLGRGPVSQAFSGKAVGTYAYQLQTCVYTIEENEFEAEETTVCTDRGSSLSVSVEAPDTAPDFGTASVSDKSWTQNSAISGFTVPAATGGNAPLSYSASGLPAGVSMSSARSVSGTPTSHGSGTATVTVTDDDGDTDTLEFDWTVAEDLVPDFGTATVSYKSWVQNSAIAAFTVPAATGGDGTLSYTISGLPAGLSMSASREVTGTPTASGVGNATVTVTDADGDTDTLSFGWSVGADRMPSYGDTTMADRTWKQNAAIATLYIPIPTSGNYPLTYSATGLPAGVSVTGTRAISGTPTSHGSGTATVTVTDNDGDTASLDFDWTVEEDLAPSFGSASIADQSWTLRSRIAPVDVPAATGGDGTLRYSASGLPSGLYLTFSTRRIQGIPSGSDADSGTATVTVRDADGDTDTLTFDWTVEDPMPSFGTATVADQTWTEDTRIPTLYLPAATGGNATLRYSADGLPDGLSMSILRRVTGTPTTAGTGTATLTVTDADGDTDTLQFGWTVESPPAPPEGPDYSGVSVAAKTWKQHSAIAAFTVGAASGGTGTLSYTASGLPNGVDMSAQRVVSGTPDTSGSGTATVTVTDGNDLTDTLTFAWTVDEDLMPDFGTASVSAKTWTQDTVITAFTVPSAMGGDTPLSYSATDLPVGVTMAADRVVSGTPTAAGMGTATVTVEDDDGDTDELEFAWTVQAPPDPMPTFGTASVSAKRWKENRTIAAFTVPAATGGDAPLSYSADGLPNGVDMSAQRVVSGTPDTSGSGTATVTVTDGNDLTDTLTFAWTVDEDLMPDFGTASVSAKTWTQDTVITAFTVPSAMGGDTPLSYSATDLPVGVTMAADRVVSGTPTAAGMGTATVTVEDDDGDTDELEFAWTVQAPPDPMPTFGTASVSAKRWKENRTIAAFTVPAATGGDAPLSYSADGLPDGVTMSGAREVSGAPTAAGSGTATVTVSDDDDDTATLEFTWTVDEDLTPTFGSATVTAKSWTRNRAIAAFTVPSATGGDAPLSYTARDLPAGVTMSSARRVSGTPTAAGSGTATVTVSDEDGDIDTLTFAWTVTAPVVTPGQLSASPNPSANGNYTVSHPSPPALPADQSSGTFETTHYYNLEEIVPGGEARYFNLGRGPVSLDFTAKATGAYTYRLQTCVYTLQQTGNDFIETDECTNRGSALTVTVDRLPAFATDTLPARTWIDDVAIGPFTVGAATGGDTPLSYSASGLPSGVTMSSARAISGTPTSPGSGTATITVTDNDGDTDTASFAWTVEADTEPAFAVDTLDARTWIDGIGIEPFTVDQASGGNAPLSYSATGLPAGVTMSADREVAGTPTATGSGTATVTVTDRDGDTDDLSFAWTVADGDPMPMFPENPVHPAGPYAWIQNSAIAAFTVDAASGGDAPLAYTAAGLPAGVAMNGTTREVAGTPTATGSGTATVTVTDNDDDTDTLTFDWTVEADTDPAFAVETLTARTWTRDTAIAAFTVDAATGGNAPLAYTHNGLPAGVTMSADREVAGTPTAAGTGTATVTVTDRDGDTDSLSFEWTVQTDSVETGTHDHPHILTDPVQVAALDIFSYLRGSGRGDTEASATYFRFTVPADRAGQWTVAIDGTPDSRPDWDLKGDGGLRSTSGNSDESDQVTLTAGQVYNFRVYPYYTASRSSLTGLMLTLTPPAADPMPAFPPNPQHPSGPYTWTQGTAIAAFTVDAATGGDAPLAYTATGLPAGITMTAARRVSGTPTATGSGTATVRVTDDDGDDDTLTFDWTVTADSMPAFPANPQFPSDTHAWIVGKAIAPFTVDEATGGDAPLAYTATDLPAGVTMSADRVVSGTPTAAGSDTAEITVTDTDDDSDTISFGWTVSTCEYPPSPLGPYTWTQGIAIEAFTVPASSCGTAPFSYSATDLPVGLSLSSTRVVAGTPTAIGSGTATVTVTDSNSDTDTLAFAWTVEADTEPMFALDTLPGRSWSAGAPIASFTVDAATGGNAPLTYTASDLPAGVTMSADRVFSGTPTASGSGTATVTVTDRDGDTDSLTFAWTVSAGGNGTQSNPHVLPNPLQVSALDIFSLIRGTGGGNNAASATYFRFTVPEHRAGTWTVAIDGSPNSGVDWDLKGDGGLSGISRNADESDEVTLTAGQVYNFRVYPYRAQHRPTLTALTLTLTAPASAVPVFPEDPPVGPFGWINDVAIAAFIVPEATGGTAPLSYTAAGLPAGVSMSSARAVSGTPTATGTGTATVTATDANDATGTLTFEWTVEADTEPVFSTTLPAQTWTQDRAIAAFTVDAPTGGNAPLAYTASGLPSGLMLSADRQLTGTPTATGMGTATVTVTDRDGDTASTTFDWSVAESQEPPTPGPIQGPASSSNGSFTLTWGSSTGATSYELQEQFEGGSWLVQYSGDSTSQALTGKLTGSYAYQVRACNGPECSPWTGSKALTVTSPPTPDTITGPDSSTTGSYTMNWSASTGATSYKLMEQVTGGTWQTVYSGASTSHALSGKASATYRYAARACNGSACSDYTEIKTVVVAPAVPSAITGPATDATGSFALSWGASTGALSYTLQQQVDSGAWMTIYSGASTSASLSGRVRGEYGFRVNACIGTVCSGWSATKTVSVTVSQQSAPVLSATPNPSTNGNYSVNWSVLQTVEGAWYILVETRDGESQSYQIGSERSRSFERRPNGSYAYTIERCYASSGEANADPMCSGTGASVTVTVSGPVPDPVSTQRSYTFNVKGGHLDTNEDMLKDLLVERVTAAVGIGVIESFILKQTSAGVFELLDSTDAQISSASSWSAATGVDLEIDDFNVDGFADVLVHNLSSVGAGADDVIVYAGGRESARPVSSRAVNTSFKQFVNNVTKWLENPSYFENTAPSRSSELTVTTLECFVRLVNEYDINRDRYVIVQEEFCLPRRVVVGYVVTRDYRSFGDAYWFSRLFTVTDGLIDPTVVLGSIEAIAIEAILERIFGTKVLGDILGRGCTGNFVYDSQTNIPCGNSRVIGDIVVWQSINTATATGLGDWRFLTTGEKQLASLENMTITDVDKVRVHRRGFRLLGLPLFELSGQVTAPNGHIYIGPNNQVLDGGMTLPWRNDYAPAGPHTMDEKKEQAVLLHELMHVFQNRSQGCVMVCMLVRATLARIPPGPPGQAYVYKPFPTNKTFYQFNIEQQAEMVQDLFRTSNQIRPKDSRNWVDNMGGSQTLMDNYNDLRGMVPNPL